MARTPGAKDTKPRQKAAVGSRPCDKSPIIQGHNPDLPEGYNTRRIRFMQAILPTEPLDRNDVEEMERRFARYLELCAQWDMKVGNQAAYAAIGIDKDDAYEWSNRNLGNPARTAFIKKVQKVCAMYREGLMEDGKVNPVTGIFWQKNYDGMKDQQEVVLTPNTSPLGEQKDAEALRQKYLENAYGITELPEGEALELPESAEGQKEAIAEISQEPQKAPTA
nr:MAG TPA: Terminase small subunit [Caudoviricetes sp.]